MRNRIEFFFTHPKKKKNSYIHREKLTNYLTKVMENLL